MRADCALAMCAQILRVDGQLSSRLRKLAVQLHRQLYRYGRAVPCGIFAIIQNPSLVLYGYIYIPVVGDYARLSPLHAVSLIAAFLAAN